MAIGPKAYKLVMDVREFTQGAILTRQELSLVRRAMEESISPAKKYEMSIQGINQVFDKIANSGDARAAALKQVTAGLPENVAAINEVNKAIADGTAARRSMMTDTERLAEAERRHAEALEKVNRLQDSGVYGPAQATAKRMELSSVSPAELASQRQMNEAGQIAARIRGELRTAEDDYKDAVNQSRVAVEKGGLSEAERTAHLDQLKAKLPAVVQAEKEKADMDRDAAAILRTLTTAEQDLAEKRARAFELLKAGRIDRAEYLQYLDQLKQKLPASIEAEKKLSEAKQRGIALDAQYLPVATQARNKLAEVTAAHKAGHVGIESYNNAWMQLTATQITGIPVVGRYASMLASVGPGAAAAAAAVTLVTVSVRNVRDQMQKIDELLNTAENIGVAADQFQRMSAAAHLADIDARAFASGIETMMVGISKAAADPSGKIGKVFTLAELDAKALKAMRPEEAFQKVTVALQGMANADDRLRSAKGIFGNPDFLRISAADFELANKNIQAMGGAIDDVKAEKFKEMDKSIDSMNQNIDLFWKNLTFEVAPGLETAAKSATKLIQVLDVKSFNPFTLKNLLLPAQPAFVALDAAKKAISGPPPVKPMANVTKDRTAADEVEEAETVTKSMKAMTDSIEDQSMKLRLSGHAYQEWKLTKAEVPEKLKAEKLAIFDLGEDFKTHAEHVKQLTISENRHAEAMRGVTAGLEEESAKLRLSDRAYRDRQVAMTTIKAGGSPLDIVAAIGLDRANDRLAKEVDVLKRRAEGVRNIMAGLRDDTVGLKVSASLYEDNRGALISGLKDEASMANLSARAHRDRQLALAGGTMLDRLAAAAISIGNEKLAKEADATKLAIDAIKSLEKEKRQFRMTARERELDDLKTAGVGDEDRKRIDLLLKEKEVRESILQTQIQSTAVTRTGTREEAEMLAQATRSAQMRMETLPKASQRVSTAFPVNTTIAKDFRDFLPERPAVAAGDFGPLDGMKWSKTKLGEDLDRLVPTPQAPPQFSLSTLTDQSKVLQSLVDKSNELLSGILHKPELKIEVKEVTL